MATVLFMTGDSAGDTLGYITRGIAKLFEQAGYETALVDLLKPGSTIDIQDMLEKTPVVFAVGFCGYGSDAFCINDAGEQENIWARYEVPFLTMHGDSPAYLFDRHINITPWHTTMYGFGDHYDFRMRLPEKQGIFGITSPSIFDAESMESLDFKAKRNGKIIFPKNAGNPVQISEFWRTQLPVTIADQLFELSNILIQNVENPGSNDVDALVADMFNAKGIGVEHAAKLRLFYVAQLDDFMRRVKCALLFEAIKDFPVEIHGKGWDAFDASSAKCTIISECNAVKTRDLIKNALAVLDFSPNTVNGFHDRFVRAVGMKTACLTNAQWCVTNTFGSDYGLTYDFNIASIREMVGNFLEKRDDVIEAGIEAAAHFEKTFTREAALASFTDAAEAVRLNARAALPEGMLALQPYFLWPNKLPWKA